MKKKVILNIIFLIILIVICIYFTGNYRLLKRGIEYYNTKNYEKALTIFNYLYEKNLTLNKEQLLYNSAKTAYKMGKYDSVIKYIDYFRDRNSILMRGNCYKKIADKSSDLELILKNYENALEEYQQGIRDFPGDKELIYNYELVKEKLNKFNDYLNTISSTERQNHAHKKDNKNEEIIQVLNLNEQNIIKQNLKFKDGNKRNEEENDW